MAEDKVIEVMEQLEQGIINTMDSEKYKAFLKMQSSFHSYSFNNAMLIFLQRPDATMVAGYQTWIKKFERNVMRGEKGITILAPCPYKYEKDVKVKNVNTGAEEIKRVSVEGLRFRTATVFDVNQTQGKPLPELCQELTGSSDNANELIKALKSISRVPVIEKDIENGSKGYYSRTEGIIAIKSGMSPDQTAKTLIHEYSHSELHCSKESALLDRATKEVQAESVAFIVANRFGIDTSQYSFEYLAAWSSGKELKELKQSFDLIQKTANKIITELENTLDIANQIKNSPVVVEIVWSESKSLWDSIPSELKPDFKEYDWKPEKPVMLDFDTANKIFEKLESEARALKTIDGKFALDKPIYGESVSLFDKTKLIIHLNDGRTAEARFDIGDGEYKDLTECIRKECGIDVPNYIKSFEAGKQNAAAPNNVLDKIINIYKNEFPAIKHISERSARLIDNLNKSNGSELSIKDVKNLYKSMGKQIEKGNDKSDLQEFKVLKDIVDDIKQAQLKGKHEVAKQSKDNIKSVTMEASL